MYSQLGFCSVLFKREWWIFAILLVVASHITQSNVNRLKISQIYLHYCKCFVRKSGFTLKSYLDNCYCPFKTSIIVEKCLRLMFVWASVWMCSSSCRFTRIVMCSAWSETRCVFDWICGWWPRFLYKNHVSWWLLSTF